MNLLLHDLRYALRSLRRSPGFTCVAVLTLALGIGATTAVFSVVNGVLLRPLPFAEQERLFALFARSKDGGERLPSYPNFLDWQRQATTLDLAYVRGRSESLRGPDGVRSVLVAYVSPRYFSVLGAHAALGRTFLPGEEQAGRGTVAVLTHHFWEQHFGGDPAAIGATITLGSRSYVIVGVMPRGARYPTWPPDVIAPMSAIIGSDRVLAQRDYHADAALLGRLRPDVSLAQAQGELNAIALRLAAAYPEVNRDWTSVLAYPVRRLILGDVRPRLLVLMAAVVLVLLVACANVTSLSLARAASRTREMAIRAALGAGRGRVVRQLLTESALLAAAGGVLGIGIAWIGVALLRRAAPQSLPRLNQVALDPAMLAFTLGVSLLVALIVGLAPALRAAAPNLATSLKERAGGSGGDRHRQRMRGALVTAEIALALVLVAGAGLLINSFWRLTRVDLGFNPAHLVGADITPPSPRYDDPRQAAALYARLLDAVRPIPGVERVAMANFTPLGHGGVPTKVEVGGKATYGEWGNRGASFRTVSPGYFHTMEIPLRAGRAFTTADLSSAGAVAIVNERFAHLYWPDESPIGQPVTVFKSAQGRADFGQPIHAVVVGVAATVRNRADDTLPTPKIYLPYTVNPWTHMALIVRATGDPTRLIPALKHAVLAVEPAIPMMGWGAGFGTMDDLAARGLSAQRFNTALLAAFALSALLLAAIGIYGLMAYAVTQRTAEIGIRMALGATRRDVLRLVVREGMRLAGAGIILGLAGSVVATRLLASLLYGVSATDPLTLASVAVLLTAVALAACWLPARRASGVDPLIALRAE
ncbi:MAG TPA: ABC transporter permease [Gemmatimonadaceae bacterium]|nr:ABC transporter permease [Gemmatimonadaceae bacterium]